MSQQKSPESASLEEQLESYNPDSERVFKIRDIPDYIPKDEAEEKEMFINAIRENPRSCPADSYLVIEKNFPHNGKKYDFMDGEGSIQGKHLEDLAILGRAEDLFIKYKNEIKEEFPDANFGY